MPDHIYLAHHGIKGQKWGVRRFRNEDGTLTEAGKKRYKVGSDGQLVKLTRAEKAERRKKADRQLMEDYTSGRKVSFTGGVKARANMGVSKNNAQHEFVTDEKNRNLVNEYNDAQEALTAFKDFRRNAPDDIDRGQTGQLLKISEDNAYRRMDRASARLAEAEGRHVYNRLVEEYGQVGADRFINESMFMPYRRAGEQYVDVVIRERRNALRVN